MNAILPFIIEHWAAISAIIAAIGLRLFPTEKNYDVFHKVLRLLDLIIPNIKKGGGRHAAKIILFFALASVSAGCYAQLNTTTRLVKFRSGVQNAIDTAEANGNEGNIWYDFVTGRYRANEGGENKFLIGGSGGAFWPLGGTQNFTGDVNIEDNFSSTAIRIGALFDPIESWSIFASNSWSVYSPGGISINGGGGSISTDATSLDIQTSGTNPLDISSASGDIGISTSGNVNLTSTGGNIISSAQNGISFSTSAGDISNIASGNVILSALGGNDITATASDELALTGGTVVMSGDVVLNPTSSASQLYSGTYTPVGTTSTNTTVVTPKVAQYMRVGNVVTVSGRVDVTFAASGVARWELSVPVATNFSTQWEADGTFMIQDAIFGGGIISLAATETVQFSTQAPGAGAFSGFCYTYTYQILP